MNKRKKLPPKPLDIHSGHKTITVSGTWGPHSHKVICADCSINSGSEVFVCWASAPRGGRS